MKSGIATWAKLAVGAVLLALLARHITDPGGVVRLLLDLDLGRLVLATLLLHVAVLLNAFRWHTVLGRLGATPGRLTTVVGTFEGMFFNLFFPSAVGGDAMRAYRAYDAGVDGADVIVSALIDRALGLWGLSLFILLAAPFAPGLAGIASWQVIIAGAAIVVSGGLAAALLGAALSRLAVPGWTRALQRLMARYARVVLWRRFVVELVPILLFSNFALCLGAWFAITSVGVRLPFADAAIVIEAASFAAAVPVTIGGWGVREGVVVVLLEAIAVDNTAAIAASTAIGLTIVVTGLVGAIVWIRAPYRGRTPLKFRNRRDAPGREV